MVEDKIKDGNGLFSFASDKLTLLEYEFKDLHKFNDYQEDLREIKKELSELKPSKSPRLVQFQDLKIHSLKGILDWLEENVPSLNHALIADLHTLIKHVHH